MQAAQFADMRPVSADSHVTEPPGCFLDRIDRRYADRAPRLIDDPAKGATFLVDGLEPIRVGSAAGISADDLAKPMVRTFDKMHRGGWDAKARLADMDRDGVHAEVVYPTVGMVLYLLEDRAFMSACFDAYNGWLEGYCADVPDRLFGVGQTAGRSPAALIRDFEDAKRRGFKSIMMPTEPEIADYDDPMYDEVWAAAVALDLPLSFHVLTHTRKGQVFHAGVRGSKLNNIMNVIRANQDILGVLVFGGVFERHPALKVVFVEGDAGWLPHFMHRADHSYDRYAKMLKSTPLSRAPSDYIRANLYFTFQDDKAAFQVSHLLNHKRLLWATDFPHTDSTWPHSMALLEDYTKGLDRAVIKDIVHDNVVALYDLKLAA
ncbi:amidohydrolase family protein [Sphingomonas profundi]|uniref:amidohydrolase family protein n=1 Tax=Alterirhizorhabdus profundi TaxID=2681549 RepID=UPI0012E8FF3D|nr:amidohydrolase family protein [Sphingomonas profundi]